VEFSAVVALMVERKVMDAMSSKERKKRKETLNMLSDRSPIPLIRAYTRRTLHNIRWRHKGASLEQVTHMPNDSEEDHNQYGCVHCERVQ
jgi:hypothetical protein